MFHSERLEFPFAPGLAKKKKKKRHFDRLRLDVVEKARVT
jgi:hypothetical protein